jgi:murein DD-endopeptidase MepM/ murein hydrolase activator NlpD
MAAALAATPAFSDVYRCVGEAGETVFTDSPQTGDAVLIFRDGDPLNPSRPQEKKGGKRRSRLASAAAEKGSFQLAGPSLPVDGIITSGYGLRHDPLDGSLRHHEGVDIATPEGTEVRTIAAGRITYSGFRGGYGNLVAVDHENGVVTFYAHNLMNIVGEGDRVGAGHVIAISGATGRCTGPHLHFEVWREGTNVTAAYLGNRVEVEGGTARRGPEPGEDLIRKIILADGSILLTDLPVVPSASE